jgi:hypothetical protein
MPDPIKHYLTYQHNVQKYFREHQDKYDGVMIPLPIAVSFPTGTYGFVRALCAKDKSKQYAIDPRTPLFQKTWNREKVRDPHRKMAGVLGEPFETKGLTSHLDPEDFEDYSVVEAVASRCIAFQNHFRTRKEDARKLAKYKKLLGVTELGELREPQFLIPPYFQFTDEDDPWFEVCMNFIDASLAVDSTSSVAPVIHFQNWSSISSWSALAERLGAKGLTACWLYPNDFREHLANEEQLTKYREAVSEFAESKVQTASLHGGYFSILLSHFGLGSFANGVGYGEWRDSGYHSGGTADIRIYVPKLHQFLGAPQVQSLIDKDPDYFAGDSELLASCVEASRPVTDVELAEALDHFIEVRKSEVDSVASTGIPAICTELDETVDHLKAIGPLEEEKYGASLRRWCSVLS